MDQVSIGQTDQLEAVDAVEDVVDDVVEEEAEEEEQVEEAPSIEELGREYLRSLGVDPDTFDPRKVKNLDKWERDLASKSTELGAIARQLDQTPRAPQAEQPAANEPQFDKEELENLKAAARQIGLDPTKVQNLEMMVTVMSQELSAEREEVYETFISEHDDVDEQLLIDEIASNLPGASMLTDAQLRNALESIPPRMLKRELNRAYRILKAENTDIEALAEKRAAEIAEAKFRGAVKKGEEVVNVKKRSATTGGHKTVEDVMNDESLTAFEKMDMMQGLELD